MRGATTLYNLILVERVILVSAVGRNEGGEHLCRLLVRNGLFLSNLYDIDELGHSNANRRVRLLFFGLWFATGVSSAMLLSKDAFGQTAKER